MSYIQNPSSIEEKSFKIIQSVIDGEHVGYRFQAEMEESIIKRAIHTSGDFDYLYNMKFTHGVNEKIQEVFKEKGTIILDSVISLNGINKRVLDQMGVGYRCLAEDEEVLALAAERDVEPAVAALEVAAKISGPKIFSFGDSPKALLRLLDMVEAGEIEVAALIGVPVGFIEVEEAKEALLNSPLPAILTTGPKGGTTIVVSTINAIIYQMREVITEDYVRYSTPTSQKEGER